MLEVLEAPGQVLLEGLGVKSELLEQALRLVRVDLIEEAQGALAWRGHGTLKRSISGNPNYDRKVGMTIAAEDALTPGVSPKPLHPISRQLHDERSTGERLADEIAGHIGSWRFLIIQSIAVFCWISLNVIGLIAGWDPYPFVLLNLLFSVQAAYTGPVLLLSQNRSAQLFNTFVGFL